MVNRWIGKAKAYIFSEADIAPLAVFRILFGLLMLGGTIRFASKGWIESLYIKPHFYFQYYGFEWVKPLGETGMYLLFFVMGLAALCMALGLFYRLSALSFFLSFTYIELIDKSNYLNHYYFVSIVALLMILLPAGRYLSLDVLIKPNTKRTHIPRLFIVVLQFQLGLVYFFAGVAKLNYDWLIEAMPLRIWLQPHTELPIIGSWMDKVWIAYVFSWFGAIYDLSIPFLLLKKQTRGIAYFLVIAFHLLTYILFQIGLFPIIMIFCTLIFFSEGFHRNLIEKCKSLFGNKSDVPENKIAFLWKNNSVWKHAFIAFVAIHGLVQLAVPFRYLLYPGNLFWTEEGYRFSWRVMLMEKTGKAFFYVTDPVSGNKSEIEPSEYLTTNQEKMMATQPDMILQFAHFLKAEYVKKGFQNPKITATCYVTLNGSGSRKFIDENANLASIQESFKHKTWILPFEN